MDGPKSPFSIRKNGCFHRVQEEKIHELKSLIIGKSCSFTLWHEFVNVGFLQAIKTDSETLQMMSFYPERQNVTSFPPEMTTQKQTSVVIVLIPVVQGYCFSKMSLNKKEYNIHHGNEHGTSTRHRCAEKMDHLNLRLTFSIYQPLKSSHHPKGH